MIFVIFLARLLVCLFDWFRALIWIGLFTKFIRLKWFWHNKWLKLMSKEWMVSFVCKRCETTQIDDFSVWHRKMSRKKTLYWEFFWRIIKKGWSMWHFWNKIIYCMIRSYFEAILRPSIDSIAPKTYHIIVIQCNSVSLHIHTYFLNSNLHYLNCIIHYEML